MISVNWTQREGEKYAKGWPMLSREFTPAQDWRAWDHVQFWLYTDTKIMIPSGRALRCKPIIAGDDAPDWYTIPCIEAEKWQLVWSGRSFPASTVPSRLPAMTVWFTPCPATSARGS